LDGRSLTEAAFLMPAAKLPVVLLDMTAGIDCGELDFRSVIVTHVHVTY
jgi:hypothetical protein